MLKRLRAFLRSIPVNIIRLIFTNVSFKDSKLDRLTFDKEIASNISKQIELRDKLPSVTAVLRVKNGAEYIEASILSIVPLVQNVIIVDNKSTDDTYLIASRLKEELSHVVNVEIYNYDYELELAGEGYKERLGLNENGSLAKFYNYCFSLATTEYVLKWDAHAILLSKGVNNIQKGLKKAADCIYIQGVEIYGKKLSHEMRLYRTDLNLTYYDVDDYEMLSLDNLSAEHVQHIVWLPVYLHIKRLSYCKARTSNPALEKYK